MTDRELLELAARAAGVEWKLTHIDWNGLWLLDGMLWRPHTHSDDALNLAVTLKMSVTIFDDAIGIGLKDHGYREYPIEDCVFKSTYRAIVRAAAEIGETK